MLHLQLATMNDQDKKFKISWENRQQKGKWNYGLVHGSLFGLMVFIIINLLSLKDQKLSDVYLTSAALSQMLTMILAGIVGYSTIKWWMNENNYKKIIEKEKLSL